MELKKIDILYYKTGQLCSTEMDGLCHIKELPYLSVVQSIEGNYSIQIENGIKYFTEENGIFIAPSNKQQIIIHHANKKSKQMQARWVILDVLINNTYRLDDIFEFPTLFPTNYLIEMNNCFDDIFNVVNICDTMSAYYKFIKVLLKVSQPKTRVNEGIQKVLNYIQQNYMNTISTKELAKILNMSESNFYLVFRKSVKMSPIEYLNRYRLTIAASLLKTSKDSIKSIAERVGIENQFYFSKIFKNKYGISPTQYRNSVY